MNRLQRLRLYKKEFEAGTVVLACSTCNKKIGRSLDAVEPWKDEVGTP